ncbi:sugar-transfer associated ATP-grasp domain-containing protein [Thalassomonas sp. RHCl1]|uniref:sugar-transfer associated ATP-grasp domain-containing protein n=1 Tax=Thalassomonas sp. RHCl1 TaxID=2995320 RepID=UPI00248B8E7D|nr:sugar-transfer associated ATP-grasp domain-containing protein [Thalassomonas sp. RHCl1]
MRSLTRAGKVLTAEKVLILSAIFCFGILYYQGDKRAGWITPTTLYNYDLSMAFKSTPQGVKVSTYLPQSSARQQIISESVDAPQMDLSRTYSIAGQLGVWQGEAQADSIHYQAKIKTTSVKYNLLPDSEVERNQDENYSDYLQETAAIAVNHPEIDALWQEIKPKNANNLQQSLQAIYDYTSELETLPFKGTTSSLTALRLGAASCNGKSRLFVSLVRGLGIPARLVGGVVLNEVKKRTSHQWVEVFIQGYWIPFDPTNGYFAELPGHYLELYRGDQSLFKHTANIQFDYQFSSAENRVAPGLYFNSYEQGSETINLAKLFKPFHLSEQTIAIFLLFPLCALITTFFRNLVGVQTFGVFVPMLVAITCTYSGLLSGLIGVLLVVLVAYASLIVLEKARLLVIPRLAATMTIITIFVLLVFYFLPGRHAINTGAFALFPVVIISFIAEKLTQLSSERDWQGLLSRSAGTLVVIAVCYAFLQSIYLQSIFTLYPEALLIVLALQIGIGRWNGIRLSELIRFNRLLKKDEAVIGINERNREIVYRLNNAKDLLLAADKLKTKQLLAEHNIAVPGTVFSCPSHSQVDQLDAILAEHHEFVIKPNCGSQGNGIVVITAREGETFTSAGGKCWTVQMLKDHVSDIISGSFSQHGEQDIAYIEPLIKQDSRLQTLASGGLADIRVIVANKVVIAAMLRLPTAKSQGKANLHQGAIGASVCLETGKLTHASLQGKSLTHHPDTGVVLAGFAVPYWPEILEMSRACAHAMPLGYLGVDICIDQQQGPQVLEVNGRPGLEIQNVQQKSLTREHFYPLVEPV